MKPISRGELARVTGCNLETIRYYERIGLMPTPERTPGGHRVYEATDVKRLTFIRGCRQLGFSTADTRELLSLADQGYTCEEVLAVGGRQLQVIQAKQASLKEMEQALSRMMARCSGEPVDHCPLMDALSQFDEGGP